jgi:hypothetical protein
MTCTLHAVPAYFEERWSFTHSGQKGGHMSERDEAIVRCLKLLRQIRDHLKRHQQWSETDAELQRLIADLEAALENSRKGRVDVLRLIELLAKAADLIATLLNLK